MANQFGNLSIWTTKNKGCSLKKYLQNCKKRNWDLDSVAGSLNVTVSCIRKWAGRYGIHFKAALTESEQLDQFVKEFEQPELNKANLLSRRWHRGEGRHEVRM